MAASDRQSLRSGSNSTNIQSTGSIYVGMQYSEIKQLILELFDKNYEVLLADASATAAARAAEVVDSFMDQLKAAPPESVANLAEPGMQRALVLAQIEHATYGDPADPPLLANLLMEKLKSPAKNPLSVACQSAIEAVGQLTGAQVDLLSCMFALTKVAYRSAEDVDSLRQVLGSYLEPVSAGLSILPEAGIAELQILHQLDVARCIVFDSAISNEIVQTFKSTYPYLDKIPESEFAQTVGGDNEVVVAALESFVSDNHLKNCFLTNTGIAVAHSNLQQHRTMNDLSIWIS